MSNQKNQPLTAEEIKKLKAEDAKKQAQAKDNKTIKK